MDVLALRRGVQAIVTNLGRTEGGEHRPHAGLTLMRQLREAGFEQPVLVYTWASRAEQERNDALAAGAAAVTASPTELFAALQELLRPADAPPAGQPTAPANNRPRPARPG
jgi:CheY-like chemotaxis protein